MLTKKRRALSTIFFIKGAIDSGNSEELDLEQLTFEIRIFISVTELVSSGVI